MIRAGLLCRCPNCGRGRLFSGFLKVVDRCEVCGFDFTRMNTGDGAAIFVMQIAGAPVVFGALVLEILYRPPVWILLAGALPLALGLSLGLMRPGKGVMIALQMRNRAAQAASSPNGGGGDPSTPADAVSTLHHPSGGPPPPTGED